MVHAGAADHVGRPSPASHRLDPLQPHGHTSDQSSRRLPATLHGGQGSVTFTDNIFNPAEV